MHTHFSTPPPHITPTVWNVMRQAASERLERGDMPSWFNPHWLTQEEAPVNALMREMGDGECGCECVHGGVSFCSD